MSEFPVAEAGRDITRQVFSEHPELMVVAFRFAAAGASGALHNHRHVHSTDIASGRFLSTFGDEKREAGPGDSFVVPSGKSHGCGCLVPGTLIDCCAPRRGDFL